jgi:hypothetical protein
MRSLFRHHRRITNVPKANPHRFRHYAASRTMPRVGARAAIHIGLSCADAA